MLILKRVFYVLVPFVLFFVAVSISNFHFFDPVFGHMDGLKRDQPVGSEACLSLLQNPTQLVQLDNDESGLTNEAWRCSMQYHELKKGEFGYRLAFLELDDNGKYRSDQQFRDLTKLMSNGQHVLITFVHGWRQDSEYKSREVQNFRVMLAYARQFMNQRCAEEQRYCNHTLTGLYIAWNGRSRVDCHHKFCRALAAPSLFFKKTLSDRLSKPVADTLKALSDILDQRSSEAGSFEQPSRMLVTGHSLGGNILARGVRDMFVKSVEKHEARTKFKSALGDLVVLFNPASSAVNWTTIQRAVRRRYGIDGTRYRFGANDQTAYNAHRFFSLAQKPVYLSLTSACDWPDFVTGSQFSPDLQRRINCDSATYYLFRLLRMSTAKQTEEDTTAIGHLEPTDKCGIMKKGAPPPPREERRLINVGTTHELEIGAPSINKRDRWTNYKNALDPVTSRCDSGAGWLQRAKQYAREHGSLNRTFWDGGASPKSAVDWMNRELRLFIQFRHSIYRGFSRNKKCGAFEITTANDPFWNVRALDNAVKDHGRFSSYPTWCAINQLVLDDVSAVDVPYVYDTGTSSGISP